MLLPIVEPAEAQQGKAGDVVGDGRGDFTSASCGQVGEKRRDNLAADIGEGVAVEEEKRGASVAVPQELYGFGD